MELLLYSAYFFIAITLAFFIPGNLLTRKLRLTNTQQIAISIIIGMVLWGWQGYVFGYLNIRWASYVYLLSLVLIQTFFLFKNKFKIPKIKIKVYDYKIIFLLISGTLIFSSTLLTFGIMTNQGFLLCCGDLRDNLLHMSYIHQVVKNFPPMEPGLFGNQVTNYHYWLHIVIGEMVRVFKLPLVDTSMRFFPILLSFLFCLLILSLSQTLKLTKSLSTWLLFFFIFSGDFIYLVNLALHNGLTFNGYIHTNTYLLVNYPFGFSMVMLMGGLNVLALWMATKNKTLLILSGLVIGSVIGFKVNTGFFALSGLGILAVYKALRKEYSYIKIFSFASLVSLAIFLPPNSNAGGLIFTGFWRAQDYIVQPQFKLTNLELARRIYLDHGNWIRGLMFDLIFAAFYFFTALGLKVAIFLTPLKGFKNIPIELNIYLIPSIILSIGAGFFFIQNTGGANSMFFITTSLFMLSVYMALFTSFWTQRLRYPYKALFTLAIILLTVPTSIYFVHTNMGPVIRQSIVPIQTVELEALSYLREKTDKNSLLLIPNNFLDKDASYVTFFADRPSYLSGQISELRNHGVYYEDRQKRVDIIYGDKSPKKVRDELKKIKIDYIYMYTADKLACDCEDNFETVFKNEYIKILKVKGG